MTMTYARCQYTELDILTLGATIEARPVGPALDHAGRYFPTDGALHVVGPPAVTETIRRAVDERVVIANRILDGTAVTADVRYGVCTLCDGAMPNHRGGACMVCRATIQKIRKQRGTFVPTPVHNAPRPALLDKLRSDEMRKFLATVRCDNEPGTLYPTPPWTTAPQRK